MDTQPIQKEILRRLLISEEGFRYSEMKPKDVESDLYNYHLQQLVKKELVEKVNDKYILTESGKLYIWDLKPLDPFGHEADKFKVAVNMILLRENNGVKEILFQLRTRLPFAGSKETIGRGIKRGESVLEAAERGFREETGLTADFHMIGTVRTIRKNSANELINDMFYHVCVAETYEGNLVKKMILVNSSGFL